MSKFNFRRLTPADFPLMYRWINSPHIKEWWDGRTSLAEVEADYTEYLASDHVYPYIVELSKKPIGYMQRYNACKVGDGWWPDEPEGTWGVDQFIGEESLLDQGLGSELIKEFTEKMFKGGEAKRIIADPSPKNLRAIRAYEKVGFKKLGQIKTPAGAAVLMELLKPVKGQ